MCLCVLGRGLSERERVRSEYLHCIVQKGVFVHQSGGLGGKIKVCMFSTGTFHSEVRTERNQLQNEKYKSRHWKTEGVVLVAQREAVSCPVVYSSLPLQGRVQELNGPGNRGVSHSCLNGPGNRGFSQSGQ